LTSNQYQKIRLAELVGKNENRNEKPKIAVFGFSYKKNTSDTRMSPVALFVYNLASRGFHVAIHDPQVTQEGFEFEMKEQRLGYRFDQEN
jgi:UDP-N-acetyl-D-mannosaminuronate dehydrogenase